MAKFIDQEVFNMCAVSAADISARSDKSVGEVAAFIASQYEGTYQDVNLAQDIKIAANKVTEFISGVLPPETLAGNLRQMQFCIKNYNLDGTKKRKKLFDGTLFNEVKKENTDKVQDCVVNIATYHMLVIGGSIPIAPHGWSM